MGRFGRFTRVGMLARAMVRAFQYKSALKVAVAIAMLFYVRFAEAESAPSTSTVCEVNKDPSRFKNHFVRLRATLAGNFEISAIRDPQHENCGSLGSLTRAAVQRHLYPSIAWPQQMPAHITLELSRTNFDVCKNLDFEQPSEISETR